MKGKGLRRGLIGVLMVVMVISGGYAVKTAQDFKEEAEIYETAQDTFVTILAEEVPMADLPTIASAVTSAAEIEVLEVEETVELETVEETVILEDPTVPGISVNFDGLTGVNPDIVAWIQIPNTVISYPVLQGENNQMYLETTYDNRYSTVGSIFMDYRVSGDFTDWNTIIYGHNVSSGIMFGSLKSYRDADFAEEHPYFFLLTSEGYLRYEVCYALVTTATSEVYDLEFAEEGSYEAHLDYLAAQSLYDTHVAVSVEDKIVTLSTCTGVTQEERFVLIGKLDTEE